METKLARITEISKEKPKEVFTSIYHLINKELLLQCHKELDGKKAKGIDGTTKAEYEEKNGPLTAFGTACQTGFNWLESPWPWEKEAN